MKGKANYPNNKKNNNNKIELFLAFRRKAKIKQNFKYSAISKKADFREVATQNKADIMVSMLFQ